jgi:acetyltransferase-like isoleucine patch superfamily enzyme
LSLEAKIRRGEGPFWGAAKRVARGILRVHLPAGGVAKPFFGALYYVHVLIREGWVWALRFCWFEPLFRSQCTAIGNGLQMELLPYLVGRGRIVLGNRVRLSGRSSIGFLNRVHSDPEFIVGDRVFIGHQCTFNIGQSIVIGNDCLIAGGVSMRDNDGHPLDAAARRRGNPVDKHSIEPIRLGNDIWVGEGARILKGVTIGDRSIVAAGAIVVHDVPSDVIVAGCPARIIRQLETSPVDSEMGER